MANEFYITAGLPATDISDSPPTGDNQFMITAGLPANDYAASSSMLRLVADTMDGNAGLMMT